MPVGLFTVVKPKPLLSPHHLVQILGLWMFNQVREGRLLLQHLSKSAFSPAPSVVDFVIVASMVREKWCFIGFDLFLL